MSGLLLILPDFVVTSRSFFGVLLFFDFPIEIRSNFLYCFKRNFWPFALACFAWAVAEVGFCFCASWGSSSDSVELVLEDSSLGLSGVVL